MTQGRVEHSSNAKPAISTSRSTFYHRPNDQQMLNTNTMSEAHFFFKRSSYFVRLKANISLKWSSDKRNKHIHFPIPMSLWNRYPSFHLFYVHMWALAGNNSSSVRDAKLHLITSNHTSNPAGNIEIYKPCTLHESIQHSKWFPELQYHFIFIHYFIKQVV